MQSCYRLLELRLGESDTAARPQPFLVLVILLLSFLWLLQALAAAAAFNCPMKFILPLTSSVRKLSRSILTLSRNWDSVSVFIVLNGLGNPKVVRTHMLFSLMAWVHTDRLRIPPQGGKTRWWQALCLLEKGIARLWQLFPLVHVLWIDFLPLFCTQWKTFLGLHSVIKYPEVLTDAIIWCIVYQAHL